MTDHIYRRYDTERGRVTIEIKGRGHNAPWTTACERALADIADVVSRMTPEELKALNAKPGRGARI